MKKALNSFLLGFTAFCVVSCDYNDPNDGKFGSDPESGWVEFSQPGMITSKPIGCGEVAIPIFLDAPVNSKGVDVYYTINDVTGSTAGLETFANIPAGSTEGKFVITNPDVLASDVEFTLTLNSTNRSNVTIGAPGSMTEETITIKLVTGLSRFVGSYDVVENPGDFDYVSNVTVGDEPNEIVLSNIYEISGSTQTSVFVNADGSLTFPDYADNMLINGVFVEGIQGNSDPCTGNINFTFNLVGPTGALLEGPVSVVLTRQ